MPTFDDVKELTTSGPLPARSAAMILSSLMPPTTLTSTSLFLASYSWTTFLNSESSRALQPTQTVSVVVEALPVCVGLADARLAPTASAASTAAAAATRFITQPPPVGPEPRRVSDLYEATLRCARLESQGRKFRRNL